MTSRNNNIILKAFTAILLCMFIGISTVHAEVLKITFDFETGQFTEPENGRFEVKAGQGIIFTITNFNRLAYKATINGEQVSDKINSIPGPFSALQKTKETEKAEPKVAKVVPMGEIPPPKTLAQKLDDAIKDLSAIKKLRDDLEEALYTATTFSHLEFLKNKAFCEFLGVPQEQKPETLTVLNKCEEMIKESGSTIDELKKVIQTNDDQGKTLIKYLWELVKTKDDPKEIKDKLAAIEKDYLSKLESMGITGENLLDVIKKSDQLESLLKETQDKYFAGIKDLLSNFIPENFSVSLTIPSVDADYVKITVTIEPIDKNKNQVYHQLQNPIIVQVKRGWKIDFSTGVFFNVNPRKRTYWLEEKEGNSNEDSTKVTLREDIGKVNFTPIIGAIMHIYPRRARFIFKDVNWAGIAFGLGTGEADKLNYYLGTGFMFGAQNRFLINFGAAMIKVDSLLPKYKDKINQEITRPTDNSGGVVESIYKLRFFLSLTYNIN